ncbi:MAG: hypothetical protein JWN63_1924 [Candidatus Acidoferrum typicum]|nr:hypothetical protein [Candidatus Acidoferrum typicum]
MQRTRTPASKLVPGRVQGRQWASNVPVTGVGLQNLSVAVVVFTVDRLRFVGDLQDLAGASFRIFVMTSSLLGPGPLGFMITQSSEVIFSNVSASFSDSACTNCFTRILICFSSLNAARFCGEGSALFSWNRILRLADPGEIVAGIELICGNESSAMPAIRPIVLLISGLHSQTITELWNSRRR